MTRGQASSRTELVSVRFGRLGPGCQGLVISEPEEVRLQKRVSLNRYFSVAGWQLDFRWEEISGFMEHHLYCSNLFDT